MAKQKTKLTPLQKEYRHELSLLKRRAKSWQKTHRFLFTDIPTEPKRVTKKSIEKIKNIRYSNLSEKQKRQYRIDYEEAYENRELSIPEEDVNPYTPPTENDFYYDFDRDDDYWWEDTPNEPAYSREEIDAFINEVTEAILDTSSIDRPNGAVRDVLMKLLEDLRSSIGEEEYYNFLSDKTVVEELTEAAQKGMQFYKKKNQAGISEGAEDAIFQFANVLNRHQPLGNYQAEQLADVINSEGYYGGVTFEFED